MRERQVITQFHKKKTRAVNSVYVGYSLSICQLNFSFHAETKSEQNTTR